jgi:predicted PurR-regulated permease PerM
MDTMISLREMMLLFLTIAGVAALVVVAIAMAKVSALASRAKQMLEENRLAIKDTVKAMPALIQDAGKAVGDTKNSIETLLPRVQTITANVESITTDGRATLGTVKEVTEVVGNGVKNTVKTIEEGMQDTADGVRLIAELIRLVISLFS